VRRAENYHADRTYKPRILKDIFGEELWYYYTNF
jgi:hypothetical protein